MVVVVVLMVVLQVLLAEVALVVMARMAQSELQTVELVVAAQIGWMLVLLRVQAAAV